MTASQVILKVGRCGARVTLDDTGENLLVRPASLLTPKLVDELRTNKQAILEHLSRCEARKQDDSPTIKSPGEVLKLAREVLGSLKEEDRVNLQELIQANTPPDLRRDPMAKRGTDKSRFFTGR
jgi:hypothetical protein